MPVDVTMLQTRRGEGGVLWTVGGTFNASDAFAQYLISSNLATGVLPTVPSSSLTPAQVAAVTGGIGQRPPAMTQTLAVIGDSFAFQSNGGAGPTGLTFTRSAGIVTVNNSSAFTLYPGGLITVVGMLDGANEVQRVPVLSRIDANNITYASAGPDGVLAMRSANSGAIINHHQFQSAGFWSHFNRLTGGAYTLVSNAGFPGAATDVIATKVAAFITPYAPQRIIYLAGYNDLIQSRTVAQTVASIRAAVDVYPAALWDIFSTWPFNSAAAANTAGNLILLNRYYTELKRVLAGYSNVRVHNSPSLFAASTGLARTGFINTTDNLHPGPRGMYEAAKYIIALDAKTQTPIPLPFSALDTRATDATSLNIVDNPLMVGTGGTTITNCTGVVPTGYSGALTGTGAAGAVTIPTRADGFGSDLVVTYTPGNADWVLRISNSLLVARFVSGATIEHMVMKVSVSGVVAGNIRTMQMGMVWIADGITYASTTFDSVFNASTIDHMQQEDVVDVIWSMRNVRVPTFSALTLARLDFTISHVASGTAVVARIGQVQVKLLA